MDILRKPASLKKSKGQENSTSAASTPGYRICLAGQRLTEQMARLPKVTFLLAAAVAVILETSLVALIRAARSEVSLWTAGLVYALPVILMLVTWYILLWGSAFSRARDGQNEGLLAGLSQRLGQARTLEEVARQIVEFACLVSGQAAVTLLVVNPNSLTMEVEAVSGPGGTMIYKPGPDIPCPADDVIDGCIDLPVAHNDFKIGHLRLAYTRGQEPSAVEITALTSALPLMALALEGALLQAMAVEQAAESETQRRKIAQNLHDSLAQNISFLRLKLDQLTGENAFQEIGVVLAELESMRASADEAYQQVRSTLDELNPLQDKDLVSVITNQAEVISRRAGLQLTVGQVGVAQALPASMRQHILYITREALHNIEKHAQAGQVTIQFVWLEQELILKISDDGVGCKSKTKDEDSHYGLLIMQNRASEMGGVLKIEPIETQGTEVTLWVPVP